MPDTSISGGRQRCGGNSGQSEESRRPAPQAPADFNLICHKQNPLILSRKKYCHQTTREIGMTQMLEIHWFFYLIPSILGFSIMLCRHQELWTYERRERILRQTRGGRGGMIFVPLLKTKATRILDGTINFLLIIVGMFFIVTVLLVSMKALPFSWREIFFAIKIWIAILGFTALVRYAFWPVVHPKPDRGDPTVEHKLITF